LAFSPQSPPDSSRHGLIARAQSVLDANDRGKFTIPAEGHYDHQVLWDSCFVAIGRRHLDVARARQEVLHLLEGQWGNGMLPHILFSTAPGTRFWWDRRIWRSWRSPLAPRHLATSGISQPPVVAEAVVRIGEKLSCPERKSWYRAVYSRLLAYHEWLYNERDPDGTGLVVQVHPWETGLDTSPPDIVVLQRQPLIRLLGLLRSTQLDRLLNAFGTGRGAVAAGEHSRNTEAIAFYLLLRRLRKNHYAIDKVMVNAGFAIQDLTYNCILVRANQLLVEIAETIGEIIPTDLMRSMEQTSENLEALWDGTTGEYYSRDRTAGALVLEASVATLMPLYSGAISLERASTLIKVMEEGYLATTRFPLPSAPPSSSWFEPKRYWQGPTWLNINWLVIDGLKRYGFADHAEALTKVTIELVERSGFREYFDPLTGEGAGVDRFSWSAALTLDLLAGSQ
jgi:Trehalase